MGLCTVLTGSSSTPNGRINTFPAGGPTLTVPGCNTRFCTADGNGGFRNFILPTATSFGDNYNFQEANYLYTPREAEALLKGGVHRVYLGNLKVGEHQLVAFFNGKGPNERDYKRGANLKFEKGVGAKYLELKITDRQRKGQPEFAIKDWE